MQKRSVKTVAGAELNSKWPAFLFFIMTVTLQAFDPEFAATRYLHRAWTAADGLPQSTVYAILQTRDQLLWVGTDGGLARFDGVQFTRFNRSNTIGFHSNSVTALAEDVTGGIWIGTYGGGLLRYRQGAFANFDQRHGLTSLKIWSLLEDSRGRLWVGTVGGGLNLLENGRVIRTWTRENGLPDDNVITLAEDAEASIWAGTRQGLCRIKNNGPVTVFTTGQGLAGDVLVKVHIERNGTLWAATSQGLSRRNGERFETVPAEPDFQATFVRSFSQDRQGRLFLGTENGLFHIRNGRPRKVAAGTLLSDQSLMALLCDAEDNLWIGTSAGGINLLRKGPLEVFSTADGISGNRMLAVLEDSGGSVWVSAQGRGLNRFDGTRWRSFPLLPDQNKMSVFALMEDRQKQLWIGTAGSGLLRVAGAKTRFFREEDGLVADAVLSLAQGPDGAIWIGTSAGLFVMHDGRIDSLAHAQFLSSPVFSLAFDAKGTLYGGTQGPVLFSFYDGKWADFSVRHGLEGRMVFAVYPHPDGTLWAGTDRGLFRQNGAMFIPCQFTQVASDIQVFGMVADNEQRLWLSTDKGLGCIEAGALAMMPRSGRITLPIRFFGEAEGMRSTVCSGGFQPTAWRGSSGRLWFSTQNGVVAIRPHEDLQDRSFPAAIIERWAADGRFFAAAQVNVLPAGTRRLEIFFTVPFFSFPRRVGFKYRLQGFEKEWQLTDGRSVVYNALPPGRYNFRLLPMLDGRLGHGAGTASMQVRLPGAGFFSSGYGATIIVIMLLLAAGVVAMLMGRSRSAKAKVKYLLSSLESTKAAEYREKLEECMRSKKPYLDPELTLTKLADTLAIPSKHLSQTINEHFGQNFNDFVNAYRIRAAIAMLSDAKTREDKLLKIAFESGFNSKSVFNAAFKKNTGFSPSDFRKAAGGTMKSGLES